MHEATTAEPVTQKREDEEQSSQNWKIKMLYDGDCPLCMREVWQGRFIFLFTYFVSCA